MSDLYQQFACKQLLLRAKGVEGHLQVSLIYCVCQGSSALFCYKAGSGTAYFKPLISCWAWQVPRPFAVVGMQIAMAYLKHGIAI